MAMNNMMGGFGSAKGLVFLVVASILLGVGTASTNASKPHDSCAPKKIIVGGSEHWHFGKNYTIWASKSGPFYKNDTLVFKYLAPNATTFPHSVYLYPNKTSFTTCNLKMAKKLATPYQGKGDGFKYKLTKLKTYYFSCGEHGGYHCKVGGMKFSVKTRLHYLY